MTPGGELPNWSTRNYDYVRFSGAVTLSRSTPPGRPRLAGTSRPGGDLLDGYGTSTVKAIWLLSETLSSNVLTSS